MDITETDITSQEMEYYRKLSECIDSIELEDEEDEDREQWHPDADRGVSSGRSAIIYAVDMNLANKIRAIAKLRGETAEKLMEAWLWDRLRKEAESDGLDLESLNIPQPIISSQS